MDAIAAIHAVAIYVCCETFIAPIINDRHSAMAMERRPHPHPPPYQQHQAVFFGLFHKYFMTLCTVHIQTVFCTSSDILEIASAMNNFADIWLRRRGFPLHWIFPFTPRLNYLLTALSRHTFSRDVLGLKVMRLERVLLYLEGDHTSSLSVHRSKTHGTLLTEHRKSERREKKIRNCFISLRK